MQSLLQQSCLHQAEMKPKKFEQSTDGWYVPEPAYQDMKFESPLNPNELPQGAYFGEIRELKAVFIFVTKLFQSIARSRRAGLLGSHHRQTDDL